MEEKGGAVDADDGGMELGYVNDLNRCVFARPPRRGGSINGRPGSFGQKFVHSCVFAHGSVTSLLNLSQKPLRARSNVRFPLEYFP